MTEGNYSDGRLGESPCPAEMVSTIRNAWFLSVDQLAQVFGVERPTCYLWTALKDSEKVRPEKLQRLKVLTRIAQHWAERGQLPNAAVTWVFPDRPTLLDLLSSPDLDEVAILACFEPLAAAEGEILKMRGNQTRALWAVIGKAMVAGHERTSD